MSDQPLVNRIRRAAGKPDGAILLLHGRGADEHDLGPLLDALDPERRLVGVFARGPLSLPPGGAHWYVVRRIGFPDEATFHPTFEMLTAFVHGLPELTGVAAEQTAFAGFSQGAVMSWALTLAAGRPRPAALIALSGFVPTVPGLTLSGEGRSGLPVGIGHGTFDPVIGVELGRQAREVAESFDADLVYRESPMGHTIDPGFIPELRDLLGRALPSA
jgi:phospholipase/carboxylesterase